MIYDEENFPSLPSTWESMLVDNACENVAIKAKLPTKEYLPTGALQVIDQGEKPIGGYTNDWNLSVTKHLPVIVFGDHTRALKYIAMPFAAGADGIKVLHPNECYQARLFFRFLQAVRLPDKGYARHFQHLRSLRLPLPPLPEQNRIADKLDSVLARVDACRDRLDRLPALLKRFRQSILAAATSGRLTSELRQKSALGNAQIELDAWLDSRAKSEKKRPPSPDLSNWRLETPVGWTICSVNQFAECLDRLRVPIKRELRSNSHGNYPYYGANGEVGRIDEFIFDDELVLVTEDETFYGREKPIAYRSSGKCWVNNHAHVLRAQTKAANDYLCYALMYYNVIPWLSGTTGRAKLTQQALNALPIACPPNAELEEIVRRVELLFAFADRLEARLVTARQQIGQLTPSLLAKAFRGELVPQDPADEPAVELLNRMAALQSLAPTTKRGRKSTP